MRKPSSRRGNGVGIQFLRSLVGWPQKDACVTWPFSCDGNGSGTVGINGKALRASRVMCELAHGPAPTPEHHAAHSCGKGHEGCVNPNHLSWKTQAENEADKKIHGTAKGGSRGLGGNRSYLTPEQVAEIRAYKGKLPAEEVAKQYGLRRGGVRYWWDTTHSPVPFSTRPNQIKRRERDAIRRASSSCG